METKNYKVLFKKDFTANQVKVAEIPSTRQIDDALERDCALEWNRMCALAEKEKKMLWDSEVYRLETVAAKKRIMTLELSTIPFSVRLPMNKFTERIRELGPAYYPMGMYTSSIVKTADNIYCFIEKSNKYVSRKQIPFIGGILSRTEKVLESGADLFEQVRKEVTEELGIDLGHISDTILKAGYTGGRFNCCLIFEVSLDLNFFEVEELFEQNSDGEAARVIGITEDELSDFIRQCDQTDKVVFEVLGLTEAAPEQSA